MKNVTKVGILRILVLVGIIGLVFSPAAMANIANSAHDFSGAGWSGGEICIACHTPHNADTTVANIPLWNHELTGEIFIPYASATMDATIAQPDGASKACLSCHDGVTALDSFGGNTGTSFITGTENLGTDLTDDHPVSFVYDAALATADGELFNPASTNSGLGGTIDDDMLIGGKVQCSSCHDVHNTNTVADTALLVITNNASTLCLTCHDK